MAGDTKRAENTRQHNLKLLAAFEAEALSKGSKYPGVAIIVGASEGGHIHVGCDMGLPPEALLDLLMMAAEGLQLATMGKGQKERTC